MVPACTLDYFKLKRGLLFWIMHPNTYLGTLSKREFCWLFFGIWKLKFLKYFALFWIKMVYCILVLVVSGLPLKCVGFPDKTGTPIFVVIATWHPSVIPPMYVYATIITKHIINVRNAILPHSTKKVRFRIHHWWWRRKKIMN